METIQNIWEWVSENLLPHSPFIIGYFSFVFIGQFAKHQIWTKKRASSGNKFFHFMRRTLAVHAPVCGLLIGLIPSVPVSPGVDSIPYAMLYWGGCGMFSSWSFHSLSNYVKGKTKGKVDMEKSISDAMNPSMRPSPMPPKPGPDEEETQPEVAEDSKP